MNIAQRVHRLAAVAAAAVLILLTAGCQSTDVVGKFARSSFTALLAASPGRVSYDAAEGAWKLLSPGGDEVLIATDFARNGGMGGGMADMDRPDAELSFDAAPFLAAGLEPARLVSPEGMRYELEDGRLMLHFELGSTAFAASAKDSLDATFAEVLRTERARIGYHEKLDHYGIKLGSGNMLEWAKDLAKNDKDLVFVLDPGPLLAAGLDPARLAGWTFAKVEMKDDAGKTITPDKLLRPFDLK